MLTVDNVTTGYHATPVLTGVSLSARAGEIVAVLGANGAGKTTLLRLICGLMTLREGRIAIDGVQVARMSAPRIARLGVAHVVEARGVLPGLTVEENILLGVLAMKRPHKRERREAVDRACALFPWMAKRLRSYGGQLSGGEQQMVAISRAVAVDPKVLLLDEPSLGVAPALVDEIYAKVGLIAADQRTVLLVEQQTNRALALAQRAYVLRRGRIVLAGTAMEVAAHPGLSEAYFS